MGKYFSSEIVSHILKYLPPKQAAVSIAVNSTWKAGFIASLNLTIFDIIKEAYVAKLQIIDSLYKNLSILKENNIFTAQFNQDIEIVPVKWLDKANINGPGGSAATYDRMVAYSQQVDYVRFPMVPLQAMQPQYRGIWARAEGMA